MGALPEKKEKKKEAGETGRCPPPTCAQHKHWAYLSV